ncbi:flagellar hook-basal body complex protein FliE [Clostridium sporogenes]|jgi:flagellar hook-basal body complex protein FliE|uniref:Flagellar hook-basal body complex protein FliE n=1 Tax=Clostridium sporogenes TaxID=1509 RepID=A0ABD6RN07_CLOSG|nr:flagellar hook-basal body complex protein FliE [Clostridium sporogenes]MCW6079722.1 flagellar hook-basal body complex protein FliE [Clostridium sporogenes]NFG96578.1 flagellar hook-basal body complex protein FliE [Clostridium sporogenes]NFH32282.1 flagellar hook-basal body complex protein FliE [Clostridium sporogenes]NFL20558.1 flagellar hook-basal body complex protein FliE [Clostridium sporogenes]NFN73317.1 flagellar hook-basal body complex protein FliE [Clostridium sporogenes]
MRVNEFVPNIKVFDNFGKNFVNGNEKTENTEKVSFSEVLKDKLDGVNAKQVKSDNSTQAFIKGEEIDIHNVMLNAEEAKMSMELAVQVRNKLVEAYQELSRMQL